VRAKKYGAALQAYERLLERYPHNPDVLVWRSAVRGQVNGWAQASEELEALSHRLPTYYEAFRQLDYALARQRRYADILPHWARYLKRRPEDPRAYVERSGTYWNLKDRANAAEDLRRACELGDRGACKRRQTLAER
jgi:tetratricopeptide (TPR) repeat protein